MTDPDQFSAKETEQRREAALQKMLATPRTAKQKPSPKKRKAKKG